VVRLVAARDRAGRVSHSEQLNLQDCSDLRGRQASGLFVPSSTRAEKLDVEFLKAIESAQSKNRVPQPLADEIRTLFNEFVSVYGTAIEALNDSDVQNPALDRQATAYGELLEAVSLKVSADDSRTGMLRPLLEIGIANITDNGSTKPLGIVCPWHPLRLQALHAREVQLSRTFQSLLGGSYPDFTDQSGRLYFRDLETQLQNAGSPEVAMLWKKSTPKVVAGVASFGGYTIVEPPIRDVKEHYLTNENPEPTARTIAEVIKSYLELQPHERDNFSVVLYNCDSAGLPTAVVNSIRAPDDDSDQDTTCQVILTHRDHGKLAQIYESIAVQESDDDAFHVSKGFKDFMARVRINIMVNEVALGNSKSGQPTDIAFCLHLADEIANCHYADRRLAALRLEFCERRFPTVGGKMKVNVPGAGGRGGAVGRCKGEHLSASAVLHPD
jgi:DNA segregation ATPase FtsK/SpoIIIE, S-DNA-T family